MQLRRAWLLLQGPWFPLGTHRFPLWAFRSPFRTKVSAPFLPGKKKHMNINKFAGLSRDWVDGKNVSMCVFFFGSFLMGRKAHKQNPPPPQKSRDNPVKILFTCFFFIQEKSKDPPIDSSGN